MWLVNGFQSMLRQVAQGFKGLTWVFAMKLAIAGAIVMACGTYFQTHYRIAIDTQEVSCMDATLMLIDLHDQTIERDALMAFYSPKGAEPMFKRGTLMAKFIRGMPGDTVEVTKDEDVLVNGEKVGWSLFYTYGIGPEAKLKFVGKAQLKDDEYWMLGTNEYSFDSRYWGAVSAKSFMGRAYVIF